ncbi:hypothetical protein [Novosphingobium album (ex Liu et al. 2023)]|uniref:Uncharacterized protein n=1 Tax=Novosphingobium album (ex Liu et al. 2023) TaxID=3031130 RepID=A0ABT5WXS4_9SPHN|nr:hypothetical protein [Novosphingobium album (ex Liu et al. 2023)]MDE8654699.1 hypothetical protein [Novosphingobium album (ex Liu et al. 2023)]
MILFSIIAQALGLVVGSILAAALFCWLCWNGLKLARHPEWGVPLGVTVLLLTCRGTIAASEFLSMTLVIVVLAAAVMWPVGRAWRQDHHLSRP